MLGQCLIPTGARDLLGALSNRVRKRTRLAVTMLVGAAALIGVAAAGITDASAQGRAGGAVLIDGNAVVTGFSGVTTGAGAAAPDRATIDLNGPAARVIDLQTPGAPPGAQLLAAPKPFTVTAGQVGQVFAVALDSANPPNIYVAATSAYGLPIVVADAGGALMRAKAGAPNARFMPGLFGPPALGGGPGSIWRIDGGTGEVRLFANVTLDDVANSGPALGGLAFDAASSTLVVADRETGMMHRFDLSGKEVGGFDHGMQGRKAAGLPVVPYDPAERLDITSPRFKTDDAETWGYAPPERLIFGLAVHGGRLYYAVAEDLQIWSVSLAADGSFGDDARIELKVSPLDGDTEISKIAFDASGRMLLAERAVPTGAYDFEAVAKPAVSRVLRYRRADAGWQAEPDEYAIGFAADLRNANGGLAIGYGYTPDGRIDRAACSAFLWSSGEQLRKTDDPALATRLAAGGPPTVDGLQGNSLALVRPANVPPFATYFVDYDDQFTDDGARGHLGDVAIWQICGGRQAFAPVVVPEQEVVPFEFVAGWGECRDRDWDRDGHDVDWRHRGRVRDRDWERRCCDWYWDRDGRDRVRDRDGDGRDWERRCCDHDWVRDGRDWERRCGKNPPPPPNTCPPHTIKMPDGRCCTPEQIRDGQCYPPPPNTCPPGTIKLPNGTCCDPQYVRRGICTKPPVNNPCPPGTVRRGCGQPPSDNCPPGEIKRDGKCVEVPKHIRINDPHPPSKVLLQPQGPKVGPIRPHIPTGITNVPRPTPLGSGRPSFTPRAFGALGHGRI
jgi:hypothetical protein